MAKQEDRAGFGDRRGQASWREIPEQAAGTGWGKERQGDPRSACTGPGRTRVIYTTHGTVP